MATHPRFLPGESPWTEKPGATVHGVTSNRERKRHSNHVTLHPEGGGELSPQSRTELARRRGGDDSSFCSYPWSPPLSTSPLAESLCRLPLELLRESQSPRGAVCGTRGSLRTMHGGGSAPSCCAFTHRVAFEEGSGCNPMDYMVCGILQTRHWSG